MALVRPRVNLIKLSLNVKHLPNALENIAKVSLDTKWLWCTQSVGRSSFVFRHHQTGFIYQLFKSGHINVTNVRKVEDIEKAISIIYAIIGIPKIIEKKYRIDNIQATGILNLNHKGRGSCLKNICDTLSRMQEECNITSLSYENQRFPGAFIKYNDGNVRCTIILFATRRFVFVGLKNLDSIQKIHDWLECTIWHAVQEKPVNTSMSFS